MTHADLIATVGRTPLVELWRLARVCQAAYWRKWKCEIPAGM
jgi:hypothetical protein